MSYNQTSGQVRESSQPIIEVPVTNGVQAAELNITPLVGGASALILVPILAGAAYLTLRPSFVVPRSNEAFVIRESKGTRVVLEGGTLVWGVRRLTRVTLNEVEVKVSKTDNDAVRTMDSLKANIIVTFHVGVKKDEKSIELAASRLSKGEEVGTDNIKEAVNARADDAIRGAAKKLSLDDIDMKKSEFEEAVRSSIAEDLAKIGLEVLSVSVSEITEADFYNERDFLDLQGHSLRTGAIEESKRRTAALQAETALQVKQRELEAEQKRLVIEGETAAAQAAHLEATQRRNAEVKASIESAQAEQTAVTEEAKALADRRVLDARRQSLDKEREVAVAQEALTTAKLTEEAKRQKSLALIGAEQAAEVKKQEILTAAQAKAEAEIAEAQAAVTVEELRARALTIAAEAEKQAAEARALGIKAIVDAQNSATLTSIVAQFLDQHGEQVLEKLPEILEALAPKPGVLGDPTIISGEGDGMGNMLYQASAAGVIDLIAKGGLQKLVEGLVAKTGDEGSTIAPKAIAIEEGSTTPQ